MSYRGIIIAKCEHTHMISNIQQNALILFRSALVTKQIVTRHLDDAETDSN